MTNRLTARAEDGSSYYPKCFEEPCSGIGCNNPSCRMDIEYCEKLAHYEDLEEQGRLIELPCRVGDTWEKNKPQGFLNAKKMPLKGYENISIFYNKPPTYNPQGLIKVDKVIKNSGIKNPTSNKKNGDKTSANNAIKNEYYKQEYTNYPNMILQFSNSDNKQVHPTQKPIALLEYLIKTYTNENETVLDNCMGSGSTGVACLHTNRKFIGMELDENYFKIAKERIENEIQSTVKI